METVWYQPTWVILEMAIKRVLSLVLTSLGDVKAKLKVKFQVLAVMLLTPLNSGAMQLVWIVVVS